MAGRVFPIIAVIPVIALLAVGLALLRTAAMIVIIIVVAVIMAIAAIVASMVAARFLASDPLFFATCDRISVDAEIMIRKLVVIFGLDAVAIDLGVLRHFLEFVEHLHGIATRATVDPVVAIGSATAVALGAIIGVPAAPAAAGWTIVHQMKGILIPFINLVFLKS